MVNYVRGRACREGQGRAPRRIKGTPVGVLLLLLLLMLMQQQ